jgi:hypothetical protein
MVVSEDGDAIFGNKRLQYYSHKDINPELTGYFTLDRALFVKV